MRSVGWLVAGVLTGCHAPPVQVPAQPVAAPTEPPVAEEPVPKDTSPAPRDERALQEAIARDLGDARAWEGLAWLYYLRSADEPGYALLAGQVVAQGLATLARRGTTSADLQVTRGLLALAAGRPDAARRDVEAALVLAPHHPRALLLVGQLALTTHDYARAWQALELLAALRSGRGEPEVWLALGVAERGLGRLEAARAAYDRAIQLAPADPRPRFNLGLLYVALSARVELDMMQQERFMRSAERHLQGFLDLAGDDPRYARERAQAERLLGRGAPVVRGDPELLAREARLLDAQRIADELDRRRLLEREQEALAAEAAAP